LINRRTL